MTTPRAPRLLTAGLLAALLLTHGCGSGDAPDASPAAGFVAKIAEHAAAPSTPAPAEKASGGSSASTVTADELLDWVEYRLPTMFPPGSPSIPLVFLGVSYTVRYYPATANYLGVTDDGSVFGLGPFTGNLLVQFETIGFWAPQVVADRCNVSPASCGVADPSLGTTWTPSTVTIPTTANARSATNSLRGVAWSGARYVAVGRNGATAGAIVHSTDGANWTHADLSGTVPRLNGVAWSGSTFVAVGLNGTIHTSSDGVQWTQRHNGSVTAKELIRVAWDGAQFLAVGWGGVILTSPDGVNWAVRNNTGANLYGIAKVDGRWFVSGSNGAVLTSTDASQWNALATGTAITLYGVAGTGGRIVAVGDDGLGHAGMVTSADGGSTWQPGAGIPSNIGGTFHLVWTGARFVGVGRVSQTSTDGVAWTQLAGTGGNAVDCSATRCIAVGDGNYVSMTP
jgi:hypothetical protein